jgi:hypothetical protein
MISDETKRVLRLLISRWSEASAAQSDPQEHRAFGVPIDLVERVLSKTDATHDDIRKAIPVCPGYPNFGKQTLLELADAERDGRRVVVIERGDGALKWEIEESKTAPSL